MTNLLNFLHSNTWGGRSLSTIRVKPYHRPFGDGEISALLVRRRGVSRQGRSRPATVR